MLARFRARVLVPATLSLFGIVSAASAAEPVVYEPTGYASTASAPLPLAAPAPPLSPLVAAEADPPAKVPSTPQTPQAPVPPKVVPPPPPVATAPSPPPTPAPASPMDTSESGLALGGEGFALAASNVGYIDSAIPRTQVRFRYDSAFDDNRPDRAEFFYAKYRSIGGNGVANPETAVNFQDYDVYVEYALNKRFSIFAEAGLEGIQPQQNPSAFGWGDSNVGFKWAFVANDNRYITFQLKNYIPTGEGGRGLGNNHYTIEPGILFYQKISDRLSIEGEVRDWEPIGGSDYEGNVLRYGIGASYAVINNCKYRVSPVVEVVGWTVLSGKESSFVPSIVNGTPTTILIPTPTIIPGPPTYVPQGSFDVNAAGDTIVNLKAGIRVDFRNRLSLYTGYGQALTGTFWYKDLIRAEIRYSF